MLPLEPSPVTLDDLDVMFKLFSGIDGHPRAEVDFEAWEMVAYTARWTRAEVAAAAMTIAASWTGFRIMPGHVTAQIVADRERIRLAWYCPDPPRELRDDPAAEIAWRRRAHADFADRALLALATGQQLADVPLVREVEPYQVSALPAAEQMRRVEQAAARVATRKAIPAAPRDGRAPLDDDTRRAVRADLDARAAAAMGDDMRGAVRAESDARAAATGKSGLDDGGSTGFDHEVAV